MRTTPKKGTKDMPFSLAFRHEAIIPAETGTKILQVVGYFKETNEQALGEDLDLIKELRSEASVNAAVRKL